MHHLPRCRTSGVSKPHLLCNENCLGQQRDGAGDRRLGESPGAGEQDAGGFRVVILPHRLAVRDRDV
jgi:hypothetical protein